MAPKTKHVERRSIIENDAALEPKWQPKSIPEASLGLPGGPVPLKKQQKGPNRGAEIAKSIPRASWKACWNPLEDDFRPFGNPGDSLGGAEEGPGGRIYIGNGGRDLPNNN